MVEVFKTNVTQKKIAKKIVVMLHREFKQYQANFDLGDVDRILRIVYPGASIDVRAVTSLLKTLGFDAEVLPDSPGLNTTEQTVLSRRDAPTPYRKHIFEPA